MENYTNNLIKEEREEEELFLSIDIQDLINEYDEISSYFLLKEYDLVWQGSISCLLKMMDLKSPINSDIYLIDELLKIKEGEIYELDLDLKNLNLLWGNIWSLLLNLIAKQYQPDFNTLLNEESTLTCNIPFDSKDIQKLKVLILNLNGDIKSFVHILDTIYFNSPLAKPIDLILGISLVSIHKGELEFLSHYIHNYINSLPEKWKNGFRVENESENQPEILSEYQKHWLEGYKSVLDLYLSHALLGLKKYESIEELVSLDKVLDQTTKTNILYAVEQARNPPPVSQIDKEDGYSDGTSTLVNNSTGIYNQEENETKDKELIPKNENSLSRWLQILDYRLLSKKLHLSSALLFLIIAALAVRRLILQSNGKDGFGKLKTWLFSLYLSIKPAFGA